MTTHPDSILLPDLSAEIAAALTPEPLPADATWLDLAARWPDFQTTEATADGLPQTW